MAIRRYAQRLLNPFRGVMNIIEYQGAEAVTTDGLHWDIYVRDTGLVQDIADPLRVQVSDIRYGHWSARSGLKRGALYPSEDFKILEHRGALVYEDLLQRHDRVPFPLRDLYELWLLDGDGLPLALLGSVVREGEMETNMPIDWRAGQECRRRFRSSALEELDRHPASAGSYLTEYINDLAGERPCAQWFLRQADDSGVGLTSLPAGGARAGRHLPAQAFPPFFLRESAHGRAHARLIQDFIAWQAPWLLLLHALPEEQRRSFEQQARRQAVHMERQHRLYPQVLDPEILAAARVEAALRRHQPEPEEEQESLSTDYIELNVTRTN
jgi:hypothetical protein